MSYTDLRDFNAEYTYRDADTGNVVKVEKLGGGTFGHAYTGTWRYTVRNFAGAEMGRGQDFHTGTPKTHAEVARELAEIFA